MGESETVVQTGGSWEELARNTCSQQKQSQNVGHWALNVIIPQEGNESFLSKGRLCGLYFQLHSLDNKMLLV